MFHEENVDEPWGRNPDGHLRPDLLAPKYFVPNHRTPNGGIGYFGGTSSASAQVAGLCALLFAQFPEADAQTIRYALIRSGDPLPGSKRPGVRVNAARAI
jgi:serine protease AprX